MGNEIESSAGAVQRPVGGWFRFWPFPLIRNCPTGSRLSRLFLDFAAAPDLRVETGRHQSRATCSLGTLRYWSANRMYAWASEGEFVNAAGESSYWCGEMPSRYAARRAVRAFAKGSFIYRSAETQRS